MEHWKGDPKEVVLEAQEERIFDDLLRRARPAYPNHPLAHAVKLEQPKEPAQGNIAFLMLFSLIPLAQHHIGIPLTFYGVCYCCVRVYRASLI